MGHKSNRSSKKTPIIDRKINTFEPQKVSNTKKPEYTMTQPTNDIKKDKYSELSIELINLSEENIRHKYNDKSIQELAESMKTQGQLEPIRVYKQTEEDYVVLVGHRRYLAAKQAGISPIKCIICDKPTTEVDRLYMQAVENEQREDISPADRETYITALINAGQTQAEICEKMGKSPAWISQAVKAKEARDTFGSKFAEAGIELDTYSAYQIAGATEEAVTKAIQDIQANPHQRKAILKAVERSKERRTTRGRPKQTQPSQSTTDYVLGYAITINEAEKSVTIGATQPQSNELIQELHNRYDTNFTEIIRTYFQEKGYTIT